MNRNTSNNGIIRGKDEYTLDRCLNDETSGNKIFLATDSEGKKFLVKQYFTVPRESFERSKHIQRVIRENGGHPHLMMSSDFVQVQRASHDFDYFEVVPFMEGVTLGDLQRGHNSRASRRVSERALLSFIPQICDALTHLHDLGIVHRDIKPDNFYLASEEDITLGDLYPDEKHFVPYLFDYNLGYHPDSPIPEDPELVPGTVAFIAPEVWLQNGLDSRVDIFALGVTLYQLATGVRPFRGSSYELMHQISNSGIRDPRWDNAHLSDQLSMVIMKALEKNPEWRYQNAQELRDDLKLAVI